MRLLKRTYTLPPHTVQQFEDVVLPGERSRVVAQVLGSWLEEKRRAELRAQIEEGCREMWDEYLEVERQFHPLEEEVERKYGDGT